MPRERWVAEVKTSNSPTTMEGTTLTLPKVEDWDVKIGHLWNCRTGKQALGEIFRDSNLNTVKYLEALPAYDMEYSLSRIGDSNGKSEILDISVEIKLELPQFTLEGGVSFRNEDMNHFKKDEFFCKYNVQTGVLRTRSSTVDPTKYDEIINDDIAQKIISGEVVATHYVSEIRYGGWATGSFTVEDKMDHNLLDLSGYVGGTIPVFPGISVGLKASIGFKLQDSKENIDLKIKVKAAPGGDMGAPQTIEDMFLEMEKIPGTVFKTPGPFTLKGVPISMKLSPIAHLIPGVDGSGDTYKLLETEMRQELQDMLLHLNDFQGNFYIFLIVKEDRRLAVFFPEEGKGGPNPWGDDVIKLQTALFAEAKRLTDEAGEVFTKYKLGNSTLDDLRKLLEKFGDSIVFPSKVNEEVKGHVAEGRALLNALRAADASLAGQPDLFIFNDMVWDEEMAKNSNGVFLSTHLGEGEEEIPGVLLTLYTLASKITSELALKVMVAVPNINVTDSKFTLYTTTKERSMKYSGDEILKILKLMSVAVYAKLRTHTNTSKFITALTENTKRAETWELKDIDEMYSLLMKTPGSTFAKRRLEIADSFLETMELLATRVPTAELTFFLPAQFHVGLADTLTYFEVLMRVLLERKEPLDFVTLVGHFDTFGGTGNAPHLIVLRRDSSVAAVCFTVLDVHLLGERLLQGSLSLENPLSPSLMGVASLAPLKVDLGIDLWNILEGGDQRVALRDCPFILQEDVSTSPSFVLFHDVLNNVAFGKKSDVIEGLCSKLTSKDAYGGTLEAVLGKHGYSVATGFDDTKEINWSTFLEDLKTFDDEFANDKTEDPEAITYFRDVLMRLVEYLVNGAQQLLKEALKVLLDKYFDNGIAPTNLDLRNQMTSTVTSDNLKELDKLLQLLRFLHLSRYNANYFQMWKILHETRLDSSIVQSTLRILDVLKAVAQFEEEEQQWVWSNGSFQEWVGYFLQSSSVVAKMYKLFCNEKNGGVPLWLPEKVRKVLLEIQKTLKDPHLRWKQEFQTLEELEKSLRTLAVKNSVPYNFTSVLGTNLKKSRNLLKALEDAGVLVYWDEEKGGFIYGWGEAEIKAAVQGIRQKKTKNGDVQLKNKALGQVETSPTFKRSPGRIVQREKIFVNASWDVFTGGSSLQLFTLEDLFSFSLGDRVSPFLSLEEKTFAGEKTLAFVFSRLQEGSLEESVDPQSVATLVDYPSIPGETNSSSFLSRSDLLTLFLNCSDEGLQFQLFQSLTHVNCSSALPWIVQNIRKEASPGTFILTLSESFADLVDLKDHFAPDFVLESRLLKPPFQMIVAVRVGPFEGSLFGKSTVLNKAVLKSCRFSSKEDPGGLPAGSPVSRKGLVELAWLSQSTCREEFYSSVLQPTYSNNRSEMVLLANVHGDFLELPEEVRRLLRATSSATFLVFWGCSSWKEMGLLRPQVKKTLLGPLPEDSSAVYNLVVDPDKTIRQEVEDRDVINTHVRDLSWTWKIQRALKDLLEKSTPTINPVAIHPTLEHELVTFVKDNSVQSIRRSLTLQNMGMFPNDLEDMRKKVLEMFSTLLALPDDQQRKKIIWKLHARLQEMSKDSSRNALGKMRLLSEALRSGRVSENHLEYSSEAFRAARNELTLNSLSLGNLLRELSLQGDSAYLELLLHDGFPLELINLNFFSLWDTKVQTLLRHLDADGKKYGVVSVVGPQGSFKSSVLNALFSPGLLEGPFGSTNGVVLRLLRLQEGKKPPGLEDLDFLLLLDSEGFSRPDNSTGGEAAGLLERQLGAWLLSISDLCLVFANGQDGVDWLSSLRGVLGTTCFAQTSLIKDSSGLADVILVQTSSEEENPLSLENELLQMLREVSNVTSTSPIETDAKFSSISRLTSLYARVLAGDQLLLHSILQEEDGKVKNKSESLFQLRQKVASSVSTNWNSRRPVEWVERAEATWTSILSSEDVFRRTDAAAINLEMKVKKKVSLMKEAIENAFADHTELLEKDLPPPEELLDFSSFDGIPYLCANLENSNEEEACGCKESLESLEEEEMQLAEVTNPWRMELIKKELTLYAMQLRADVEARLREERLAEELATKEPQGQLNAALKAILASGGSDEESWAEFKGHVSSLLNVAPWWGIIKAEIEGEYGPEMLKAVEDSKEDSLSFEDDVAFDVDNLLQWGRCAFDVHGRYEDLGGMMGWEEWVWLELQVEVVVKRELVGFRRGLVRSFREEVNNLLGGVDLRGRTPPELPFTPAFLRRVHFLGLVFLVKMWEEEWSRYVDDYNPLTLLLDKQGDFPNDIFLPDDA